MKINSIQNYNNLNIQFNSSYEYREKRGQYIRNQLEEYDSKSVLNKTSSGILGIGLVLLAFDKIKSPFKNLKRSEQVGLVAFVTGGIIQSVLMFKHFNLSLEHKKEYDQRSR